MHQLLFWQRGGKKVFWFKDAAKNDHLYQACSFLEKPVFQLSACC